MSSNDAEMKYSQLQAVFLKATDSAFYEIGPADLEECFSDIKQTLGASIDAAYIRNMGKSRDRVEVEFLELLESHKVKAHLEGEHSKAKSEISMDSAIDELFNIEAENMKKLVAQLEIENSQLNERKKVLDQRLHEQLVAIKGEQSRLESVSRQLS